MANEKIDRVSGGNTTFNSIDRQTDRALEQARQELDPSLKKGSTGGGITSTVENLNPTKNFAATELETLDDIMKNEKLKDAWGIFSDEKKLEKFNNDLEKVKKLSHNPFVKYVSGSSSGGDMIGKVDSFIDSNTDIDEKTGKPKIKKLGKVLKESYQSGGGFFSKIGNVFKALFGYGVVKRYQKEVLLWKPMKELVEKVKKYAVGIGDMAGKAAVTGGAVFSEYKEHKGSKAALDAIQGNNKKELDAIYKRDTSLPAGEVITKTQNVLDDTCKKGMSTDPHEFKQRVQTGKIPGMRVGKAALGFAVVEVTTDAFLAALKGGDFGDIQERWKEDVFTWENIKQAFPGVGSYEAITNFFAKQSSGQDISTEEAIELAMEVGFDALFLFSVIGTGGAALAASGAKGMAKNELKELAVKNLGKNGGKELLKKTEKEVMEQTMKKTGKGTAKTIAKTGRGEILKMSFGNVSQLLKSSFPNGKMLQRMLLNNQQRRLFNNMRKG